jgi:hypothetical protein
MEGVMEALGVIAAFLLLGALAMRFGADSRYGLRSKEEQYAARGLTWQDLWPERVPSVPSTPRRFTAAALRWARTIRLPRGRIQHARVAEGNVRLAA